MFHVRVRCLLLAVLLRPVGSIAQTSPPATEDPALRFRMPDVTVTAQKEPEDKQRLPTSVTAVSRDAIGNAGINIVSDAAIYVPNTFFTEFTARKLSNARFRGISSSPNNPGITTYIDGVPADQRQFLERRAPRRRSDRARPRTAERAVRPEHAGRPGEHHEQPPVQHELDGQLIGTLR